VQCIKENIRQVLMMNKEKDLDKETEIFKNVKELRKNKSDK
jgi:hypothetical protein